MKEDYRRHDILDRAWRLLESHLPGRHGAWRRVAKDIVNELKKYNSSS